MSVLKANGFISRNSIKLARMMGRNDWLHFWKKSDLVLSILIAQLNKSVFAEFAFFVSICLFVYYFIILLYFCFFLCWNLSSSDMSIWWKWGVRVITRDRTFNFFWFELQQFLFPFIETNIGMRAHLRATFCIHFRTV